MLRRQLVKPHFTHQAIVHAVNGNLLLGTTVSPAGFEALELLDEEGLQNLGTLVKGRVAGVVVPAVVEDFGHVCYKFGQFDVVSLVQLLLHGGQVWGGEKALMDS